MTPSELGKHLAARWPDRDPASLAYSARYALPLVQVPPRGLWGRKGRTMNTTLEAWTGRTPVATTVDALVLRYLRAFGPASASDIRTWSWFTGLREVVERLRPRLRDLHATTPAGSCSTSRMARSPTPTARPRSASCRSTTTSSSRTTTGRGSTGRCRGASTSSGRARSSSTAGSAGRGASAGRARPRR